MLSTDLIDRIRDRASDPGTRFENPPPALDGGTTFAIGGFKTVRFTLGGEPPPEPGPLPAQASAEEVAAAEARLGFALPDDLKQLYMAVADGGYGPSGGLASLAEAAERYGELTADPPGEDGQAWPQHLLPINLSEPGADCYDLKTGEIVYWDEESLADGPDDEVWQRSFRAEAKSLGDWMETWLAKPSAAEREQDMAREAALTHLRTTIPFLREKTPEERAEMGIEGDDWEEEMCRRMGVDPRDLW